MTCKACETIGCLVVAVALDILKVPFRLTMTALSWLAIAISWILWLAYKSA